MSKVNAKGFDVTINSVRYFAEPFSRRADNAGTVYTLTGYGRSGVPVASRTYAGIQWDSGRWERGDRVRL